MQKKEFIFLFGVFLCLIMIPFCAEQLGRNVCVVLIIQQLMIFCWYGYFSFVKKTPLIKTECSNDRSMIVLDSASSLFALSNLIFIVLRYFCNEIQLAKYIGRTGLFIFILIHIIVDFRHLYLFVKPDKNRTASFSNVFVTMMWIGVRAGLLIIVCVCFLPHYAYSKSSKYKNGMLVEEQITDGIDLKKHTYYNDDYKRYVTEQESNGIKTVIYYDTFPNKISHIDTLSDDR